MAEKKNTEKQEKYKDTCFVIMPISDTEGYDEGHFEKVYEQIFKPAIKEAGYTPLRADENRISDAIIIDIIDAIQYAPMALCDLSANNPNVMYELGLRQAYDKPVMLVKDDVTKRVFDISGIRTVEYKKNRLYENVKDAREEIKKAIEETKKNRAKYSLISILKATKAPVNEQEISDDDATKIMIGRLFNEIEGINKKIDNMNRPRFVPKYGVSPLETDLNVSSSSQDLMKAAMEQLSTYIKNEPTLTSSSEILLKKK